MLPTGFFFYWAGDDRVLHSFPTRRSSDLHIQGGGAGAAQVLMREIQHRLIVGIAVDGGHEALLRSEEHTSELQSHSDLVCRLLLEKKKNQWLQNVTFLFCTFLFAVRENND